jgi:CRISPR-associated protein Cas8b1/Cst1 subtype I-B
MNKLLLIILTLLVIAYCATKSTSKQTTPTPVVLEYYLLPKDVFNNIKSDILNKLAPGNINDLPEEQIQEAIQIYDDLLVWFLAPMHIFNFPPNLLNLLAQAKDKTDLHNLRVIMKKWWFDNIILPKNLTDEQLNTLYNNLKQIIIKLDN